MLSDPPSRRYNDPMLLSAALLSLLGLGALALGFHAHELGVVWLGVGLLELACVLLLVNFYKQPLPDEQDDFR